MNDEIFETTEVEETTDLTEEIPFEETSEEHYFGVGPKVALGLAGAAIAAGAAGGAWVVKHRKNIKDKVSQKIAEKKALKEARELAKHEAAIAKIKARHEETATEEK